MSNTDKRSVATDALETLGNIIGTAEARDAIHLAVEPIEAATTLAVGAHVALRGGKAHACPPGDGVGIVDPFLMRRVEKGERFWLVVYPRTITSLRHVWAHPAFAAAEVAAEPLPADAKSVSERWIRDYAEQIDVTYNQLMGGADSWVESKQYDKSGWGGDYLCLGGTLEGISTSPAFWKHYEVVRGVEVVEDHKQNFFTCSC